MRAVRADRPGGPEVLKIAEIPEPVPRAGEVLIAIRATALNRADLLQRRGKYPPPAGVTDVLGLECAGVVDAVGPNTSSEWLGRRVMTLLPGGGYAERATAPAAMAMPIPDGMSFEQAAAIPEAFLTAHHALFERARLLPGERLFVTAAAGGVGSAVVQLAVAEGAQVIACAGTDDKCAFVEELGAKALNYRGAQFSQEISEIAADVIIDFVGGANFPMYERMLQTEGRLVVVGVLGGHETHVNLGTLLRKRQSILGMVMRSLPTQRRIAITQHFLRTRYAGFSDGRLKPLVDRVFDWSDVAAAHEHMEQNLNHGKIVLRL